MLSLVVRPSCSIDAEEMEAENMKRTINILVTLGLAQGLAHAQPAVSSVLNAASYDAVVSPGCWVAFGSNLAAVTARREYSRD